MLEIKFCDLVILYEISATANILGRSGVGLGPRKDGEPGVEEEFHLPRSTR